MVSVLRAFCNTNIDNDDDNRCISLTRSASPFALSSPTHYIALFISSIFLSLSLSFCISIVVGFSKARAVLSENRVNVNNTVVAYYTLAPFSRAKAILVYSYHQKFVYFDRNLSTVEPRDTTRTDAVLSEIFSATTLSRHVARVYASRGLAKRTRWRTRVCEQRALAIRAFIRCPFVARTHQNK